MSEQTTGRASYCPEDNKIRLYVGRVPREEFLALRAEGWTTLHKQREAGGGDFAATWTPERYRTALKYSGGVIEDEDMDASERAADRAERFVGYRDKRADEASEFADRYDAGPQAHGYQSQAKAERAARKHDRIGNYATDAWSKAEYWKRRTEGVIRHALHRDNPGVRMGRIKELEADLRRYEKERAEADDRYGTWKKIAAMTEPDRQTEMAYRYAGMSSGWSRYTHPVTGKEGSLWDFLRPDQEHRITGAQAAQMYLDTHTDPSSDEWLNTGTGMWMSHVKLRLAYENQMLEAQGGRLEQFEVAAGGKLGGKLILKVSKSSVTKRVTSCAVLGPRVSGWAYKVSNIPNTEWAEYKIDLERIAPGAYTPPTEESLAELKQVQAKIKGAQPKKETIPLINPTDEDAERLQAIWNARGKVERDAKYDPKIYNEFKPSTVCRIKQDTYSQASKGSFSRAETRNLHADGELADRETNLYSGERRRREERIGPPVCKIRITSSDHGEWPYVERVIVITDKPQKPLPEEVWQKLAPSHKCPHCGERFELEDWGAEDSEYDPDKDGFVLTCPNSECNKDHIITETAVIEKFLLDQIKAWCPHYGGDDYHRRNLIRNFATNRAAQALQPA